MAGRDDDEASNDTNADVFTPDKRPVGECRTTTASTASTPSTQTTSALAITLS